MSQSASGPQTTDPTFYRSAAEAVAAPTETLAYVVAFDRAGERPDALTVIGTEESSDDFGKVVGWADLPTGGNELHHFGWNACSSALMHAGHDAGPRENPAIPAECLSVSGFLAAWPAVVL